MRYDEHRFYANVIFDFFPAAIFVEKIIAWSGLLATFRLLLFFGLDSLLAELINLEDMRFHCILVQRLQIWIPRDAEVEILVVEALDLDFGRVAASALALAHPRLDRFEVVGEEDVLPLL